MLTALCSNAIFFHAEPCKALRCNGQYPSPARTSSEALAVQQYCHSRICADGEVQLQLPYIH
jgi:hypothetical protein